MPTCNEITSCYYFALINWAGGLYGKNLDQGHEYRPNAASSLHTIEVKIFTYRSTKLGYIRCLLPIWHKQKQFNLFNVTGLY